jgi:hypothetical protein
MRVKACISYRYSTKCLTALYSTVDPPTPNAADRAVKVRSQQEVSSRFFLESATSLVKPSSSQRQGLAYILVRQATSLLQRTRLNVVVSCQAWHAKNARHMLLGKPHFCYLFFVSRPQFWDLNRYCGL